jgi:hypothetical protein
MPDEGQTTQELRLEQLRREEEERRRAEDSPTEEGTDQHDARAMKAAYLRGKLEERAKAEREAAEEMESTAHELEERAERVGEQIDETRGNWESKKQDASVPGAQKSPDELDEQSEGAAGEDDGAA